MSGALESLGAGVGALLRLRRQGRNSPIRRIHDQRRPLVLGELRTIIPPELIVRVADVLFGGEAIRRSAIFVESSKGLPLVLGRVLVAEYLFP
jgi:hypothetical protein